MNPSLKSLLNQVFNRLEFFYPIYKDNMVKVYALKEKSKAYMNELADIDEGLNNIVLKNKEKSLSNLLHAIRDYNSHIDSEIESFSKHFNQLEECLIQLFAIAQQEHKQSVEFVKLKRQLNLLEILLEKYRTGIHNLQLTNNILLNFSEELKKETESFRCNLIQVSSLLLDAEESMIHIIKEFEPAK